MKVLSSQFSFLLFAAQITVGLSLLPGLAMAQSANDDQYAARIAGLGEQTAVQAALAYIEDQDSQWLQDLIEITEIPAPPFAEQRRAEHYAELLREAGLTNVSIDEAGNVIGRRPGSMGERVIAYSAHLDTVFPEDTDLTVRQEGARLYAPGIGDNSRGLVSVLAVLRALEFADIQTEADLLFIGNVGEEGLGDLRGMKHLFREDAETIDALIAVDGGTTSRIVNGGVGSHRYRVTFTGPGGHSWGAFGMANPQHALGRAIALFDQNALPVTREGTKTTYNVGRMGGGTSINSIPFEAWMEVDMRSGSQDKLDEIDQVFRQAIAMALEMENFERQSGPQLEVDIQRVGTRPAAEGDDSLPLVKHAVAATRYFGIEPELQISSTDANLPLSLGVPAITMSRGGVGGNSHSPDEWWENVDGHISIQIGLLTLLAEAGLSDHSASDD